MEEQQSLVCPTHTTQYALAFVAGVLIGSGALYLYLKQVPVGMNILSGQNPAFNNLPIISDIRSISGVVTSIDGNRISIKANQSPFDDANTKLDRIVIVTKDTQIVKITAGDIEAFQKEMEIFMENTKSGKGTQSIPPMPPQHTRTVLDISSIKTGDTITATATENIKDVEEFSASEIQI